MCIIRMYLICVRTCMYIHVSIYPPPHEQDRVDELSADNEKIKQKYTAHRRKLQRHRSEPRKLGSLSSSKLGEDKRARPKSGKRPNSASRRSATHLPPSSLALISENVDTARQEVPYTSGLHTPTYIFPLQFVALLSRKLPQLTYNYTYFPSFLTTQTLTH